MSEKTIRVKKEENRLLVYYSPSINFDEVVRNIAYGTLIKGTFWVTQDNLVEVNEEEALLLLYFSLLFYRESGVSLVCGWHFR